MDKEWGIKCVCCGLDTVGRDYEAGGFSCGNCGIKKDSDSWDIITTLRARVAELSALVEDAHEIIYDNSPGHTVWLDRAEAATAGKQPQEGE